MSTLERIIDREILIVANSTAEALQVANNEWVEDCENLSQYVCPHCGEVLPSDVPAASEDHAEYCYQCPSCSKPFDDPEMNDQEVMQWWIVTDWLAEKLLAHGEPVWVPHDVAFWGRTGCGYSLEDEPCLLAIDKEIDER